MSKEVTYSCDLCHRKDTELGVYGIRWLDIGGAKMHLHHTSDLQVSQETLNECIQHLCVRCHIAIVTAHIL